MQLISRRYSGIWVLMLLSLILLVTGCGNVSTETTNINASTASTQSNPENKQASTKEEPQVRTIEHAMGKTEIKGTPERIVVLSNEGTEALLALGVTPVGAVKSWLGEPWYEHIQDKMQNVTVVGDEMQPNLELIAGLKPDLILGVKVRQEKIYQQLSDIAPTVFSENLSANWKQNFLLYADALNKKADGEKAISDFDARVAKAKEELGDKILTKVSIVRFLPTTARIYFKDSFSGALLSQLGFARPAPQDKEGLAEAITKERIPEMDGDILFYFIWEDDMKAKTGAKNADDWKQDKLWKKLGAVKNNKAFEVSEAIWNTSGGILSANLMLDDLLSYFK